MPESRHALHYHARAAADRAVLEILDSAEKHPPLNSYHEAKAVLEEEFDELWTEIKQRDPELDRIQLEAIQVAAVALRIAMMARRGSR